MRLSAAMPIVSLACLTALGATFQEPRHAPGPAQEPPLRARVTLDGMEHEVTLGEQARTTDGRPLLVELLPTRTFRVPGAFGFTYPRGWNFIGSVGAPKPVDAWWSLSGEGAVVHLRRHDGDAGEVQRLYASNLEAMDGTPRQPITGAIGDRELEGVAVEIEVGGVRGGSRRWVQEVFAWQEAEGVSWMLSVQRDITPPGPWPDPSLYTVEILLADEGDAQATDESRATPPTTPLTELDAVLASWHWE